MTSKAFDILRRMKRYCMQKFYVCNECKYRNLCYLFKGAPKHWPIRKIEKEMMRIY